MVNEVKPNFEDAKKLYEEAKGKSNYGHWSDAVELFLEAAENFRKLGERAWAARDYGRVAWNKMEAEEFEEVERFLEISRQLDFNQGTLNYIWSIFISSKKGNVNAAREYLLESISMIYQEIKFDRRELEKQWMLLATSKQEYVRRVVKKFYDKKIKIEEKINPEWAASQKARVKALLALLTKFDPLFYEPSELRKDAETANLERLPTELENKEIFITSIENLFLNINFAKIKEDISRTINGLFVRPIFKSRNIKAEKDLFFVLMPFRPPFVRIFNEHIKPTLEELGFRVVKANDIFKLGQ